MARRQRISIVLSAFNLVWPLVVWGNLSARVVPNGIILWISLTLVVLVSCFAGLWSLPIAAYLGSLLAEMLHPEMVHSRRGMNNTVVLIWGAVCGVGLRCFWFEWNIFRQHLLGNASRKWRGPILWLAQRPRQVWAPLAAMTLWVCFLAAISFLFLLLGPAMSGSEDWPWNHRNAVHPTPSGSPLRRGRETRRWRDSLDGVARP